MTDDSWAGDGDGWVRCAAGHRHWGRFGAAGLLISDGERAILQHRAPWTHEGDTWSLPGGARDSHEDPTSTALREAREEADLDADLIEPIATWVDDHGGWSYTTVLARPRGPLHPHAANAESTDVRWWPVGEIDSMPLHPGLAATWPSLRLAPPRLGLVIDSRAAPWLTGWLADEASRTQADQLIRHGVAVSALPRGLETGPASVLLPTITVVGATPLPDRPAGAGWWRHGQLVAASAAPDARAAIRAALDPGDRTSRALVISSDALLCAELSESSPVIGTVGPDWLAEQLNRHATG